ncbi:MAG: VCBS repeat-containing protein [Chloroflexota bacterium]
MYPMKLRLRLLLVLLLFLPASVQAQSGDYPLYLPFISRGLSAPQLKWAYGGCYASWCETGWYSSPAVINIDGDSQGEIIASAYTLWALDGETGTLQWRVDPKGSRTWPGIVLADLERDGTTEIVVAQGGGWITVYTLNGTLKWERQPSSSELRGLLVADLDGNASSLEVIVTSAIGSRTSTWVLESNGNTRPGWPQITSENSGYAWGVYNDNASAANLSGDSRLEIIVPTDVHYILGLNPDGSPLAVNASTYPNHSVKVWGRIGVWEDLAVEIRSWGYCQSGQPRSENYRPNFANSPASIADLDNNGQLEIVVVGNVYDCSKDPYQSRYYSPFIFNADRTRFNISGFDWRSTPVDTGTPLSEDYNQIESALPNPVLADLDGDGLKEILYASYDGRVHAFWLDKTEHGSWPFSVYNAAEGFYRFASEPAVADLDDDGLAEVIFTSWPQKGNNRTGKLHILSAYGQPIFTVDLPAGRNGNWNGALPAPTLANVDNDNDLEIVLNTAYSGVVVYDLAGTARARLLWATGRGNYQRTGAP